MLLRSICNIVYTDHLLSKIMQVVATSWNLSSYWICPHLSQIHHNTFELIANPLNYTFWSSLHTDWLFLLSLVIGPQNGLVPCCECWFGGWGHPGFITDTGFPIADSPTPSTPTTLPPPLAVASTTRPPRISSICLPIKHLIPEYLAATFPQQFAMATAPLDVDAPTPFTLPKANPFRSPMTPYAHTSQGQPAVACGNTMASTCRRKHAYHTLCAWAPMQRPHNWLGAGGW